MNYRKDGIFLFLKNKGMITSTIVLYLIFMVARTTCRTKFTIVRLRLHFIGPTRYRFKCLKEI